MQHLAKIRSRRVSAEKAVPPPLRRGGGGGGSKKQSKPAKGKPAARTRSHRIKDESDEDSDIEMGDFDAGSGSEYGKKPTRASAGNTKDQATDAEDSEGTDTYGEGDSANDDDGDELVAQGARFLHYPNFNSGATTPSVPSERSKVVVLKYGPKVRATQNAAQNADAGQIINKVGNPNAAHQTGAEQPASNVGDPNTARQDGAEQGTSNEGDSMNLLSWAPDPIYGDPFHQFPTPVPAVPEAHLALGPLMPTYNPDVYDGPGSGMPTLPALEQGDPDHITNPWPYSSWGDFMYGDSYPVYHDNGVLSHFASRSNDMPQADFTTSRAQGNNADASGNP